MIDLDAYEKRLRYAVELAYGHSRERAVGLLRAIEILQDMRAGALPDPAAPSIPPMHGAATTQAMRKAAWPNSGTIRRLIIGTLNGHHGCTDDDLEVVLDRTHQSVSSARYALVRDGWVEAAKWPNGTALVRPTRSGNPAQVWCLTLAGISRLQKDRMEGRA